MSIEYMHYAQYRKGKPACVQTFLVKDTENTCAELKRANQKHITTTEKQRNQIKVVWCSGFDKKLSRDENLKQFANFATFQFCQSSKISIKISILFLKKKNLTSHGPFMIFRSIYSILSDKSILKSFGDQKLSAN